MGTLTMNGNALLDCVMKGRQEYFCAFSRSSPLPGAAVRVNEGTSLYCSGIDYAPCNGVMEEGDRIPSEREIGEAIKFFGSRKLPFIWWSSFKDLEKHGFQFGGVLTGIAVDISKEMPKQSTSSRVEVKLVQTTEDLKAFAGLSSSAFGMNESISRQCQAVNTAAMKQGNQMDFLALVDGVAVGTATLSTCDSSAGIWNLSTVPEYRKQGIATALVSKALVEARRLQYDHVMAILMPKGMAWGLFTKLHFKETCQFPFYVHGVSADQLER